MNTGCPRPVVRDAALQLLQILDKRFFGVVGPLAEGDLGMLLLLLLKIQYKYADILKTLLTKGNIEFIKHS